MSEIKTAPRRLVELNPRWIETHDGEVVGFCCDCPCGSPDCGPVRVPTKSNWLEKPVTARSLEIGWALTGTSFENVTLSPSLHYVEHWHGYLRNGVLESC